MQNRLKAYVKRTVLKAAQEYAYPAKRRTTKSTQSAFKDAMQGATSGWWNDLIYTAPALDMASKYRANIQDAVLDYLAETGDTGLYADRERQFTWGEVIAACSKRRTWAEYNGDKGRDSETLAMALLWGLQFAVEWYTGEVAREVCPDL